MISENYPAGAEFDSRAPWNDNTQYGTPAKSKTSTYSVLAMDDEMSILLGPEGKKYFFYYSALDRDVLAPYAEREIENAYKDEEGDISTDYSDNWNIDENVIENYVNDNLGSLSKGVGIGDAESGVDIVEIDEPFKEDILNTFAKPGKKNAAQIENALDSMSESINLSEGIRDKEPFEKIAFGVDIAKVGTNDRMALIGAIKKYNGETIKKSESGNWYTFIPVDDVSSFISEIGKFKPNATSEIEQISKFKPRVKNLKDGQEITFLDYNISETDPPSTKGYLKPGFINPQKSLLKWVNVNGEEDEEWIYNKNVDAYGFLHRDLGDVTPKDVKVYFYADMDNSTPEERQELFSLIKKFGGRTRHLVGAGKASGGQEYALIPLDRFDDFYHEAEKFEPYIGSMEKDKMYEEEIIDEARKIVRNILKDILHK
jgi:hypothetical protein